MKNLTIARLTAMLAMAHAITLPDEGVAGGEGTGSGGTGGGTPATPPTPASSGDAGKTFTEDQVEGIVKDRLERDRKAREAEAKTKADREKMDAEQRAKAEKQEAEDRAKAAEARALRAERKASITGQVIDPEAAMKLLDEEKHLDKDGNVKVEALLKDYPYLAPAKPGRTAPGGGGSHPADPGNPADSWAAAEAADTRR